MLHLVRNAVDHGIETLAERKHAGKPENGTLTLEAYHESNHIVIEITDDGRGLDPDRIKAKVIIEANYGDFVVEPSFGTHFFQNLITFGIAYLTINSSSKYNLFDWDWLNAIEPVSETEYIRHVQLEEPLEVLIDGRSVYTPLFSGVFWDIQDVLLEDVTIVDEAVWSSVAPERFNMVLVIAFAAWLLAGAVHEIGEVAGSELLEEIDQTLHIVETTLTTLTAEDSVNRPVRRNRRALYGRISAYRTAATGRATDLPHPRRFLARRDRDFRLYWPAQLEI